MTTTEQNLTDLAEVTDLGNGATLIETAWESRAPGTGPSVFYAKTRQVAGALTAPRPVDALAALPRYAVLDRTAPDPLLDVPLEVSQNRGTRYDGSPFQLFLPVTGPGISIDPALLVTRRGSEMWGSRLHRLDGTVVPRVMHVNVSARDYDLEPLALLLDAHPWVTRVGYDPASHGPAELVVYVMLPPDAHEAFAAASDAAERDKYGLSLSQALFGRPGNKDAFLGDDPLGIVSARRTSPYPEPSGGDYGAEDEDWVPDEDHPALHDRPSFAAMQYPDAV